MEYIIECKPIQSYQTVPVYNKDMEEVGQLSFTKGDEYNVKLQVADQPLLYAKSNRLMPHKRYELLNADKMKIATVKIGVKIIHSIIEHDTYLIAKASFWKLRYNLFDNRTQVGQLHLFKNKNKRWFSISSNENDFISIFGLFLLAHAIRIKALLG